MVGRKIILYGFFVSILCFAGGPDPLYACSLSFLPGDTGLDAPAIDGTINTGTGDEWSDAAVVDSGTGDIEDPVESRVGDPCLAPLMDGGPSNLESGRVKVYTKRRSNNLYIAVDVSDGTEPATSDEGSISPRDQIMLYLDGDLGRGNPPSIGTDHYYRLQLRIPRNGTVEEAVWNRKTISSDGASTDFTGIVLPEGIQSATRNKPDGDPGYEVEIKIPFSAFGYTVTQGDFGMAVAVLNDLGFQETVGGVDLWQMTGVGLPDDMNLPVEMDDDPIDYKLAGSKWNDPGNWGEAFTSGAGDTVYFSHDPKFWKSEDIVTAFCPVGSNAESFNAVGQRSTENEDWYKYYSDSDNVCPIHVAAKLRRTGALVGVEERRVLFLWGQPGIGPREWYYMHDSEPPLVALDPSSSVDGEIHSIATDVDGWEGVPSRLSGHPCVRAIALPKELHPVEEAALVDCDSGDPEPDGCCESSDSDLTDCKVDLDALVSRYDVSGRENQAQMNIITINETSECGQCNNKSSNDSMDDENGDGAGGKGDGKELIKRDSNRSAKNDISDFQFAQVVDTNREYLDVPVKNGDEAGQEKSLTDAVFDLTGYGIDITETEKDYTYIRELGGIQVVANLEYMRREKEVEVPIRFTNPTDSPMRVFVDVEQLTPVESTQIGLSFDLPKEILEPGETVVLKTRVKEEDTLCKPSFCRKCSTGSEKTRVAHAAFLVCGLGGLGLMGYRRRRRETSLGSNSNK